MGEKVKRKNAEQFRHLQDEAYGVLSDPNLLSDRRHVLARAYRCRRHDGGAAAQAGSQVILIPQADGRVLVLCGNRLVGEVVAEDCSTLVVVNREEPVLPVGEVSEQSELTGDFLVVCRSEDGQDDSTRDCDDSQ